MNKLFKTILISLFVLTGAGFLFIQPTLAGNPLTVEFETTPLFYNIDIKPGDSVTRWVKVTNNYYGQPAKQIAVEAINFPNSIPTDDLSHALNIVIKEGSKELYSSSLYDFYLAGETYLSDINPEETIQYDFTISFPAEKGNEWQTKTTHFDILIGFQGEETPPAPPPSPPDGGNGNGNGSGDGTSGSIGGGGGTTLPPGLTILDESVLVTITEQCNAIITWTTTYFSTSQVIYATEAETHILDLTDSSGSPAKFGYSQTSREYDNDPKVTGHSVTLTGLTPNTTYYFRCISHASPPTISRQFSFDTNKCPCEEEPANGEETGEGGEEGEGGEVIISPSNGEETAPLGPVEEEGTKEEGNKITIGPEGQVLAAETGNPEQGTFSNFLSNLLANISDVLKDFLGKCFPYLPWLLILALAVLLIRKYFSKEKRIKGDIGFILGILIILILFILWFFFKCLPVWLVLLSLIIYFFGADFLKRKEKKRTPFPQAPII